MGGWLELGAMTSAELGPARTGGPTLLVPLGSTEQHGPHLPLDTDTRIAAAVAAGVAAELDAGVLVAPALPYGASGEHQGFAGTVSIGTPALAAVLVEYVRSAAGWAGRVVFVNGHGGNVEALNSAVALARSEGREAAWCPCVVPGGDAHAGDTETSLLLHLAPAEVRVGQIRPGNTAPLAELMPRLRSGGVAAVSEAGVLGDPSAADAGAGARHLAGMVADCAGRVRRWRPGPGGMLA